MIDTPYEPSTYEVMCFYFKGETEIQREGLAICQKHFTQVWRDLSSKEQEDLIKGAKEKYGEGK